VVKVDLEPHREGDRVVHLETGADELREAPIEYRRRLGDIERCELRSGHMEQSPRSAQPLHA